MDVTGGKTDIWLVKMVALLTVSIAITLLVSGRYQHIQAMLPLALCAAISYVLIDIYYTVTDVIAKIYLADAAAETAIILMLIASKKRV